MRFWFAGIKGKKACQNGFTLLEVLLAMIIVGISLTMAAGLFSGSLKMAVKAGDYTLLSYLADSKLNEASILLRRDTTSLSGSFDGDFNRYNWHLEKKAVEGALRSDYTGFDDEKIKAAPGLYQVEVTVTWTEGERERNFRLSSYQSALVKKEESL